VKLGDWNYLRPLSTAQEGILLIDFIKLAEHPRLVPRIEQCENQGKM